MYKILSSGILFILSTCCMAQTNQNVRYYKDQYLSKEVTKEKASFSCTTTQTGDTIKTEVKNINTNTITSTQYYKGDEPIGIWLSQNGARQVNYDFPVVYTEDSCSNTFSDVVIKDYFNDMESIDYVAPKLATGESSILKFLVSRFIYPERAKAKKIQGTVIITFIVNTDGQIEDMKVKQSVHILLDKEVMRMMKLLSFSSPAMFKGKPQSICVTQSIRFTLS